MSKVAEFWKVMQTPFFDEKKLIFSDKRKGGILKSLVKSLKISQSLKMEFRTFQCSKLGIDL